MYGWSGILGTFFFIDPKEKLVGVMMVQRGLGGPVTDQQRELLKIAYQGSQTMLELVNNLLDIAKMEQGEMRLDMRPLSPYFVISTRELAAEARSRSTPYRT